VTARAAHRPTRPRRKFPRIAVPILAVLVVAGVFAAVYLPGHSRPQTVAAAASSTGTLSANSTNIIQGGTLALKYGTPSATVNRQNWIGLYPDPGDGPANQAYVGPSSAWSWAPAGSGTASFGTSSLTPGTYIAYYLSDNGYTWLAHPVRFTVASAPSAS
jgi:hypothetical protein